MCSEKPPKKWLFETHVVSRRMTADYSRLWFSDGYLSKGIASCYAFERYFILTVYGSFPSRKEWWPLG